MEKRNSGRRTFVNSTGKKKEVLHKNFVGRVAGALRINT